MCCWFLAAIVCVSVEAGRNNTKPRDDPRRCRPPVQEECKNKSDKCMAHVSCGNFTWFRKPCEFKCDSDNDEASEYCSKCNLDHYYNPCFHEQNKGLAECKNSPFNCNDWRELCCPEYKDFSYNYIICEIMVMTLDSFNFPWIRD